MKTQLNKDVVLFAAVLVTFFVAQVASFTPNATIRNETAPVAIEEVAVAAPAAPIAVAHLESVMIVAQRHLVASTTPAVHA